MAAIRNLRLRGSGPAVRQVLSGQGKHTKRIQSFTYLIAALSFGLSARTQGGRIGVGVPPLK